MKLIKPITVDDSVFVSSSVPEDEYPAWAWPVSYSVGNKRIYAHRIYESLTAHTSTAITPDQLTGGATPTWADIGPTNQRAMFDAVIGTSTTATDLLTVTLAPGNTSGLALIELVGKALSVQMTNGAGGTEVYSKQIDLDATVIVSIWDYLFAEHQQKDKVALTDLPIEYLNAHVIITIIGNGTVKCGVSQPGITYDVMADTEWPIDASFEDFSTKITDPDFGIVTINPKPDRMLLSFSFSAPFYMLPRINKLMRTMKRTLAVYVPVDREGFETLITFGYAKEFIASPDNHKDVMYKLEIEELV